MDNLSKLIILSLISSPVFAAVPPINLIKSAGSGPATSYRFGPGGDAVSSSIPSTGLPLINGFSVVDNLAGGASYLTEMAPVVDGVIMKVEATQDISIASLALNVADFVVKTLLVSPAASFGQSLSKYLSDNGVLKDPTTNQYGSKVQDLSVDCQGYSAHMSGCSAQGNGVSTCQGYWDSWHAARGLACMGPPPWSVGSGVGSDIFTPMTSDGIRGSLAGKNPSNPSGVISDILKSDPTGSSLPAPDGPLDLSLPTPSVSKPSVQTVTPDGKVQTKTDTVSLTKTSPSTFDAIVNSAVQTVSPDGTTTTANTSNAPAETTTVGKTDCEKFPNDIGCSEYGTAPTPDVIETVERKFSLSPTSLGSGSCPAPNIVHLSKTTLTMSYQPYCDFASMISPVVIAMAWFSAGLIVLSPIKNS